MKRKDCRDVPFRDMHGKGWWMLTRNGKVVESGDPPGEGTGPMLYRTKKALVEDWFEGAPSEVELVIVEVFVVPRRSRPR